MKHVPNLLSALRILLSPVLIATADRPPLLAALMLLAGATDAVDGIIARRFDCQTRLGARLDSVADWTFFLALGWVFCTRYESVVRSCLTELVVVLALRLAAIVVGWMRFRRLLSVHTLGNKISAVIAFVLLVRIVWCGPVSATALRIALLFAALTALEELLIIVRSRTPDPNQRSLFGRRCIVHPSHQQDFAFFAFCFCASHCLFRHTQRRSQLLHALRARLPDPVEILLQ